MYEYWEDTSVSNQERGRKSEAKAKRNFELRGYNMERNGPGYDYKATKTNHATGKKETKYVEVKSGTSQLTDIQKENRKSKGGKYKVVRNDPWLGFRHELSQTENMKKKSKTMKRHNSKKKHMKTSKIKPFRL